MQTKITRLLGISFFFILIFSFFVVPCSALTINGTYSDLSYNNTNANNLITYAMNYDSFINSKFVIFRSEQYEYYIVWGDLHTVGTSVTSSGSIEYIRYYRLSDNFTSEYKYEYGSDTEFLLNSDSVSTSNIDGYGFKSPTFNTLKYEYDTLNIFIFSLALLFIIVLVKLRRS